MASEEQKMKNMVENLIGSLGQKGIKVESAAILKLNGKTDQEIDTAVNQIMKKLNPAQAQAKAQKQVVTEKTPEGDINPDCFCPNCFRFDNFEERLQRFNGQFDYVTVSLLGKQYNIKYHRSPEGKEHLMIQEKQFEVDPKWDAEQIQNLLNQAVQNKDFAVAQELLNQLNSLNKNQ